MHDVMWDWPIRQPSEPVTVLAHRGGAGPWRQNTLEAFAGALRLGADGVELDVRRCHDGTLVVLHDPEVPGLGPVHERLAEELPPWVPELGRALEVCAGALVNVEVKNAPTEPGYDPDQLVARDVAALLATLPGPVVPSPASPGAPPALGSPASVIVSSFFAATLVAVRDAWSAVPLGLLVHPAFDPWAALETAASVGCVALHPHVSQVSTKLVVDSHARDMAVVTWTVNEPAEVAAVVSAGVDTVITDEVGQVRRALRGAG